MKEAIQYSLKNGLKGAFSHSNPVEAIASLDVSISRKRLAVDSHSIWEILFHIVFWQDIFIENIKGNDPEWDDKGSWPTEEHMEKKENFEQLKVRFKEGIEEIEKLTETVDLEERLIFGDNRPPRLQFVIVAITHNSYHTGQLLILRNILKTPKKLDE
ncbi:MAG: DinB family protein [Candidatus Heimdallarchaeota archaeon]|nr:DinB family protein [Candidatus Heimdallarchaeota archaeon]